MPAVIAQVPATALLILLGKTKKCKFKHPCVKQKIPSRSVMHSTLFNCTEFCESGESGECGDLAILVNLVHLMYLVIVVYLVILVVTVSFIFDIIAFRIYCM